MSDERWVEIETRLAFQDRAIARLEEAAREQQKQLDRLAALCERLRAKSAAGPDADLDDDPPPPHYGGRAGE
jgi:SlyX protein